ncbi:hypothetical protein PVAP13_3NG258041 [Panicum virgatum]|uniref:Uncharacterized protein n=1 Tax=Panicum virgatum TaxID=38727 RepID=A0A8T0U7U0_PANVG|nr:hypothetical protein PVAP13_3NG258041 [Panicum virgatum]
MDGSSKGREITRPAWRVVTAAGVLGGEAGAACVIRGGAHGRAGLSTLAYLGVRSRPARRAPPLKACRAARALLSAPWTPTPRPEISLFSFSQHRAYRTLKFLAMVARFLICSHDFSRNFCASVTP